MNFKRATVVYDLDIDPVLLKAICSQEECMGNVGDYPPGGLAEALHAIPGVDCAMFHLMDEGNDHECSFWLNAEYDNTITLKRITDTILVFVGLWVSEGKLKLLEK